MKKPLKNDEDIKEFMSERERVNKLIDENSKNPNLVYKNGVFVQKEHIERVKREFFKGKSYFVARDSQGRIKAKIREKGSGLTSYTAKQLYKENGTFKKEIKRDRIILTNVIENQLTKNTTLSSRFKNPILRKPSKFNSQYFVSAEYNGKIIVGRSHFVRKESLFAADSKEAKKEAWNTFLKRLAEESGLSYDEDEGVKQLSLVTNLKEGWIYYSKRHKNL